MGPGKKIPRSLLHQIQDHGINPTDLVFYLNSECNLRCKHCYIGNELLSKAEWYDLEDSIQFINSFERIDRLILLGGEPFIYPDFQKLVNALNLEKIKELRITSNLTDISALADFTREVKSKIRISVSLDGYDEASHDFIRGKGTFNKTVSNLKTIIANQIDVEVTHTIMTTNIGDFWRFRTFCSELGITKVNLHRMSLHGNGLINKELQVSPTDYVIFRESLKACHIVNGTMQIRFPLLFTDEEGYQKMLENGTYHPHAKKSFYSDGLRIIIYPTRQIFISSEMFGTESFIGHFNDEIFYLNESKLNELLNFKDQKITHSISELNPHQRGDHNYPVVLSVSYKETVFV